MTFFAWVGIMVIALVGLLWIIANLACATQFWMSMYIDVKRWRQRMRDKKAGAEVKSPDIR